MKGSGLIAWLAALHARMYGMTYRMVRRMLPTGSLNHTVTLLLLSVFGALNLLSVLDLLWLSGIVPDPYQSSAATGGHAWVWSVVVISIQANVLLGRRSFRAMDREQPQSDANVQHAGSYFLGSLAAYVLTFCLVGSFPG